jgi:hypothetical protein
LKDDGFVKSPSAALRGNPAPLDKDLGLRAEEKNFAFEGKYPAKQI